MPHGKKRCLLNGSPEDLLAKMIETPFDKGLIEAKSSMVFKNLPLRTKIFDIPFIELPAISVHVLAWFIAGFCVDVTHQLLYGGYRSVCYIHFFMLAPKNLTFPSNK